MFKYLNFIALISIISNSHSYEVVDEFTKPFKNPTTRNILLSGSLLTASMIYIDRDFDRHNQAQISKHNVSFKLCKFGNEQGQILPNILYTLVNAGLAMSLDNGTVYKKRAIDMFNATLYSGLLTDIIKPIINERRPSGGNYSFPSGHATTAFAFASYISMEHEWYYGLPAYLCAFTVGYSRVASNFHYPHDIVAGAAIGISYGMAQFYKNYLDTLTFTPLVLPTERADGMKILLTKEF